MVTRIRQAGAFSAFAFMLLLVLGCGGGTDQDLEQVLSLLHNGKQEEAQDLAMELSYPPPRSVGDRVLLARVLIEVGKPRRAVKILESEKLTPAARDVLALAYLRSGDRVRARRRIEEQVEEGRTSALTHRIRGELLFDEREIEDARSALREAKRRDPEDPTTWRLLAATWILENDLKRAEAILKDAAPRFPGSAEIQGMLGELMLARWPGDKGVMTQAVELLARACELRPLSLGYRQLLAQTRLDLGYLDSAESELEGICEQWPKIAHNWNDLGRVRMQQGKVPEAVEAFETAAGLAVGPGEARLKIFLNLGQAQLTMCDRETERLAWGQKAFKTFKAAQAFAPNDARVMVGLAQSIVEMNPTGEQVHAAMRIYQKAIEVDPTNFAAHLNLALLYYDLWINKSDKVSEGKRKALKHFRAAEAIVPVTEWDSGARSAYEELQ